MLRKTTFEEKCVREFINAFFIESRQKTPQSRRSYRKSVLEASGVRLLRPRSVQAKLSL